MPSFVYAYPNLGFRRPGLGNMLIMWAKCELFARDHGVPILAPQWSQPHIGPILRREKDLRFYFGLFKNRPEYIRGLKRRWLIWKYPLIDSDLVTPGDLERAARDRKPVLIDFYDYKGLFEPLFGEREFVSQQLKKILSSNTQQLLDADPKADFIAAHIRRGDKPTLKHGEPVPDHPHWGLPDEWFIRVIESAREKIGSQIPVRIFSDARPDQLTRITSLPNVTLAGTNNALVDILLLSRAKALITSGTSTFSAWAVYLGEMPTIWFPSLREKNYPRSDWTFTDTDLDGNVSDVFAKAWRETKSASIF